MLMGPWSHFVQDNHVQEGDICIFQPLKTAGVRFTLMVHLIHQSKVGTLLHDEKNGNSPSPAGGTSSSRGKTMRSKANDLKIVHSTDGKAKAEVTPIARVKEEPADPGPSNSKGHWTDDESDDSGGPSEAGLYILSAHAHLADEQRNKVEDMYSWQHSVSSSHLRGSDEQDQCCCQRHLRLSKQLKNPPFFSCGYLLTNCMYDVCMYA